MTMFRAYESNSGQVAISGTGVSAPLLFFGPPSTADGSIFKIRVSCEAGSGTPTVPTSSSLFFSLNKVTGTKAGGSAVTPSPLGPSSLAANVVVSGAGTAITGLTQSTELWGTTIPFAPGSSSTDDDPSTGEEVYLAASGSYAIFVNVPSGPGAGTNLNVRAIAWHAE